MRWLTSVILVALVGTTASAQKYVSRLYDTACLEGESLLTRSLSARIVGSCESDGSTRLMHISVTNTPDRVLDRTGSCAFSRMNPMHREESRTNGVGVSHP